MGMKNKNTGHSPQEFAKRRRRVLREIGRDSLLCVRAAPRRIYAGDVDYPYRQSSDFAYLTGLNEDAMVAVFAPGCEHGNYILFCTPNDDTRTLWEGRRVGVRAAAREHGADLALPVADFAEWLPRLLGGRRRLYCDLDDTAHLPELAAACAQARAAARGAAAPRELADMGLVLHEMRIKKSPSELRLMRRAAEISVAAHRRAWRVCRPGLHEHEIAAELLHEFHRHGAASAYPPIVGGGANACVLHYTDNRSALKDGDLLLIDAGAEVCLYAGDVTRTIPVNGRFRPAQRELYEIVLEAQEKAIAAVVPGHTWEDVHAAAVAALTRGLVAAGLLRGRVPSLIRKRAYSRFYMHGTGHWLGMNVHDAGAYMKDGRARRFEPGMVLTIEPGLYVRAARDVSRRWWNTGIRIEDDVLVTSRAPRVLTAALPKEAADIEAAMAQ